jgi:hypothetical protein
LTNNGKAKIEKTSDGLMITVPSKKNELILLVGIVWMALFLGFLMILFSNPIKSDLDTNVFLIMGIAGIGSGLTIAFALLWGYFGQEKFIMDGNEVFFEKTVFNIGIKNRLDISGINNFRTEFVNYTFDFKADIANSNLYIDKCLAFCGFGTGKIKFDYGLETYSFGFGVDDAEADDIVELLKEQFKEQ